MGRTSSNEAAEQLIHLEDRIRVISDVTRRFAEVTSDYDRLLQSVAQSLAESLREACTVFLLNQDGTALSVAAVHAVEPSILDEIRAGLADRLIPLEAHTSLRHVITSGEALLIPQVGAVPDPQGAGKQWQRVGLHSALMVPIRVQGRPIGALTLGRFRAESPAFQQRDQVLAQTLADHAGLAIENARLFAAAEEARRSAEQSKQAMRRTEAAYQLFFESNPNASYVIDATTLSVLAVNHAALQLYGYTEAEFLGLSLSDLRCPEDEARLNQALQQAGTGMTSGMAQHRRKDGSLIHVEGGSHLSTFQGRPARLVLLSDQTQRVRAEAERDQSAHRLQRTLDALREGYAILDHQLRYVYLNRAGAEHTHLPREALLGHSPVELYPGFEGSDTHQVLRRALEDGVPQKLEVPFQRNDGEPGFFELNIQPVPEGLVVLSIDQTERHRAESRRDSLEDQLRQAQKLEAVGRLAGGVAHDFNNVLSVIMGYTEDVLQTLDPSDGRWQDLKEIERASVRAATLTRQLLMFSRQQVIEPKVLDLNDVVSNMDRMLPRLLGEQVTLSILPGEKLGRVRADRGNLEQIVVNLAVNARDAMPQGGQLTIETTNVVADEEFVKQHLGCKPGPYVRLAVTDTGVGMDPETRARIFEPFFSTKEQGKGTGLGLATVFGIVQQNGGGIWVYSEPGHGTTFKVYLPRVDAELDAPTVLEPHATLYGTETILLVEDEQAVREVARRILERHGYTVLAAASPRDALALCDEHSTGMQLLITDLVMPQLSGTQLAQQILAKCPALKVLYISGYTDGSIESQGVLQQGSAFLQKPFTSEHLTTKVRQVLAGPKTSPPKAQEPIR